MDDAAPRFEQFVCPIEATVALIGGKWKTVILWNLKDGKVRFNKLMSEIPRHLAENADQTVKGTGAGRYRGEEDVSRDPTAGGVRPDPVGPQSGPDPWSDGTVGNGKSGIEELP